MAAEAAISFNTSRRLISSFPFPALGGNSWSRNSTNWFVSESCSRLCQRRGAPAPASFARAAARSTEFFALESSLIVSLSSPVTRRTGLQWLHIPRMRRHEYFVFGHELPAQLQLIVARGRLVIGIENFRFWPHIFLGLAMAFQAPGHVQRARTIREGHFGDLPVAGGAADALGHVNAVIEIDEIRQRVDANPFERFIVAIAGAHRFEHGRVRPNLGVAGHAGLRRGDPRKRRFFDRCVTVAAIESQLP